ncbi:MAG: hypothetical protein HQM09_16415 [Candidatus Riflebacteria bacterium]|nr:hypothetical protein [Candidatus Riflebacteria bacterium]
MSLYFELPMNTRGYTLLELMAIVSVVAVVSTLALPSVGNFQSGARAGAEARIFLADVRAARYEAINTGHVHRLVLTKIATDNTYSVEQFSHGPEDPTIPGPNDVADPAQWWSILDEATRELSPEVTVTADQIDTIYFTPAGKLVSNWSWGEDGVMIFPRQIFFNYGNATMTITLTAFGGYSSTESYEE